MPSCTQIDHARGRVVALSIISIVCGFCSSAVEQFPKGRIAIAGFRCLSQSSAKRIPRVVIAQFLRYASSAVIDILCFDLVPCAGTGIRGYAFHAVVVGCGDAMRIFLFSAPPFDAFRSETS